MLSMLGDPFFQRAILAALFTGVACSLIGVLVVTMRISFLGVCMSHAAFAGALIGIVTGINPMLSAVVVSLISAGALGPIADHGNFSPDTAIGIIFSSAMGISFLLLSMIPGPKSEALALLWGSILTVTSDNLFILAVIAITTIILLLVFFKEIQVVIFSRDLARSLGLPATAIFYGILVLSGLITAGALNAIGGLLVFSLIVNPAAAAYQMTYNLRNTYLVAAVFGVASGWIGLALSTIYNLPTGALIILVSCAILLLANLLSPKRRNNASRGAVNE